MCCKIHHDSRDSKFYIINDEACGEYKKEQMVNIVLRYVDNQRFMGEHFFEMYMLKQQ